MSEARVWADVLNSKHEWGPSGVYRFEVEHEGHLVSVQAPDIMVDPETFEARAVLGSRDLLTLLGHHNVLGYSPPVARGILMVAKRRSDGAYAVHVWHELYEPALKSLRLDRP